MLQSSNGDQLSGDNLLSFNGAALRPCSPLRHPPVFAIPINKRSSLKIIISLSENGGSVKSSDEDELNSPPNKIRCLSSDKQREAQIGVEVPTPPPIGISKPHSDAISPNQHEFAAAFNKPTLFELLDMCVPLYVDMSIRNECIATPREIPTLSQSSAPPQEAAPRNPGIAPSVSQANTDLAFGACLDALAGEVFNLALLSLALPESPIQQPLSVELKAQESKLKMARLKLLMSQCSLLELQEDILKSVL